MSGFLVFAGILGWVAGILFFMAAKGAIHEGAAITAMGFGTLSLGLASINSYLAEIAKRLRGIEKSGAEVRNALTPPAAN